MVDKSKTAATKSAAQETGNKKMNANPGSGNAAVTKNVKAASSVTAGQQRSAPQAVNLPPQNSGSQVPRQKVVANCGLKNGSKPPNLQPTPPSQQHQRVSGPQNRNIGPQSAKSQNIGPQCATTGTQQPRVGIPTGTKSNPTGQIASNSMTSQPQAPVVQQSQVQKPMPPIISNQQLPAAHNQSEIAPPPKRTYSEVANPQQQGSPQRPRPEGVSPQASPVRSVANLRPRQPVNRRRAPGLAKPVKPAGETQPTNDDTQRQDPKESDNVPKRKILCSRDGRETVIEPNTVVTLPGSSVNIHEDKRVSKPADIARKLPAHNNLPKLRPMLPAIQEIPAQQVKPVMKDASTCTLTPSSVVDAAVQVPDDEENAGDEIEDLLVKRPWDTERVMKMQVLLDEKVVVEARMKEMLRKRQDELKSTKQRCSELETVIKASNMQGKPQLVAQVDELTDIKNELVEEVTHLTVELEKERTNVKSLKTELVDVRAQLTAARKKGANPTGQ
jgi:hypothetical protein